MYTRKIQQRVQLQHLSCAKFCVLSINLQQNNRNEENLRNRHPLIKENTEELHGSIIGYIYGNNKKKISVTNIKIHIWYRCTLTNTKILKTKIASSHKYKVKIFLIPYNTLKEISLYIKPNESCDISGLKVSGLDEFVTES